MFYRMDTAAQTQKGTKLYVGGLPYSSTEESLSAHFASAGEVLSSKIISDRMTGRSRGFGFVEMASDEGAKKAIEMFHGQPFEGRNLIVNEARPLEDRPPRRGGFGAPRAGGFRRDDSGMQG